MSSRSEHNSALMVFMKQLASGGGAGAMSKTAVAPMDRIKTLLQVQSLNSSRSLTSAPYLGPWDCFRRIPQEQGMLSFWRGNGANVLRIVPNAAIKFTLYDQFKVWTLPLGEQAYSPKQQLVRKMASGGLSGAAMTLITYPLDLARTLLTADISRIGEQKMYNGLIDCVVKTARSHGVGGLYRGLGLGLLSIVPYLAVGMAGYDTLKGALPQPWDESAFGKMAVGAVAGVMAQTFTYPADTVRRRLQMNTGSYIGAVDCFRKVVATEGWPTFYKGCGVNIIKAAPGAAIQFTMYDVIKEWIIN